MRNQFLLKILLIVILLFLSFCDDKSPTGRVHPHIEPPEMVEVSAGRTSYDNGHIYLDYDIGIGKFEVTNKEFVDFLNGAEVDSSGSYYIDLGTDYCHIYWDGNNFRVQKRPRDVSNYPVIQVTWYGAVAYCNWLNRYFSLETAYDTTLQIKDSLQNLVGRYRLPSAAEWEYAARGGKDGNPTTYAGSNDIDEVGWYRGNSDSFENSSIEDSKGTMPVARKLPNELGIYDMSGNVWEWTNTVNQNDQIIYCGGGWNSSDDIGLSYLDWRSLHWAHCFHGYSNIGFRLAITRVTEEDTSQPDVDNSNMIEVSAGQTASNNGSINLDYDIYMGKYEVTNGKYVEVLNKAGFSSIEYNDEELMDLNSDCIQFGYDGDNFYIKYWTDPDGDSIDVSNYPVNEVSFYGAVIYCNLLSKEEGLKSAYNLNNWKLKDSPENLAGYRLPTSNEWEYAARGGKFGDSTTYAGSNILGDVGWYLVNSTAPGNTNLPPFWRGDGGTMPVGRKQPNELGIYDMSGNVSEWTTTQANNDEYNWVHGGNIESYGPACQVDDRGSCHWSDHSYNKGFRITRTK